MKKGYFVTVIFVVVLVLGYLAYKFFNPSVDSTKVEVLKGLNHLDWLKRDTAITELLQHKDLLKNKKAIDSVIELFNREIAEEKKRVPDRADAIDPMAEKYGEAFGEYYIEVLRIVSYIDDERVIPGLVDSVEWGRGVWESLARFGDKAVDPLIEKFKVSKNELKRWSCVDALRVVYQQSISNSSKERIRRILQEALKDEDKYVQKAAEEALKEIQ